MLLSCYLVIKDVFPITGGGVSICSYFYEGHSVSLSTEETLNVLRCNIFCRLNWHSLVLWKDNVVHHIRKTAESKV